jgi:hypothetical protein
MKEGRGLTDRRRRPTALPDSPWWTSRCVDGRGGDALEAASCCWRGSVNCATAALVRM